MLNVLRRNSQHWLVMAIIVVVIVGLAFFFGYSSRQSSGAQTWAAKVGSEKIKMGEFLSRYRTVIERYKRQFGGAFDERMLDSFNIRGRILQEMIYERIIAKEAEDNHISVPKEELREAIASVPYFQKDGKFNMEYYKTILNYNRTSPQEFEKMQYDELVRNKLRDLVASSSKTSDEEVIAQHKIENEKISLSVLKAVVPVLTGSEVTKKEIDEYLSSYGKKEAERYFTEHNEEFKKGDSVQLFDDVKEQIAKKLILKRKQEELAESRADAALKMADISRAAGLFKQKVLDTGFFARSAESIGNLPGSNVNDVLWAFGLKKGKLYSRQIGGSTYIVSVRQVQEDRFNSGSRDFNSYKEQFVASRGAKEYMAYLDELKKNWAPKIKYSPALATSFRNEEE